ncbi:hypothetical protein [Rhodoflexus caldus]|uniref:hypothetical protein n=1 Tax=Rhodoflexus caldus TaxID=2891236 RepID=UPI00202ABEF0|nr:hypothetical protein [Rhodoflexus caldus]
MYQTLKIKFLIIVLLFAVQSVATAQQSITVVKLSNGGRYLETKKGWSITEAYYVGPSGTNVLIQSIKKAIEWHDLNRSHRMSFTKEVNRFKVQDKFSYEFHGYISQFANTAKVIFKGYADGSSDCMIVIDQHGHEENFITMSGRSNMEDFLNILQGKSARPEIDNIFRN